MRSRFVFLLFVSFFAVLTHAQSAQAEPPARSAGECVQTPAPRPCVGEATSTRMRSVPLFVTGIVFDVIGAAGFSTGAGLLLAGGFCSNPACVLVDLAGVAAMGASAVFLAIGIPLTVAGATSVPDVGSSAMPTVRFAGTSGSMAWSF